MKKVILPMLILSVMFAIGISAYGAYEKTKIEKSVLNTEVKTLNAVEKAFKNKDMEKILRNNGLYEDEIQRNMTDYLRCIINYNISEDVNNIFIEETEKGKDLDKLLQIFQFLFMANRDYSLLDDIYDYGLRSNFKNDYWLEAGYNFVTNNIGGVLTEEDIVNYVDQGISYDDIILANNLCFKGTKKINEILDERLNKKDWIEIINSIYPELKIDKNIFSNSDSSQLYEYVRDALMYQEDINEMYDKSIKDTSQKTKKQAEKRYEILNKQIEAKNIAFGIDKEMIAYAKEHIPELTEEEIKDLLYEGYLIREIKRGLELSDNDKTLIKKSLKRDYKGGIKNVKN